MVNGPIGHTVVNAADHVGTELEGELGLALIRIQEMVADIALDLVRRIKCAMKGNARVQLNTDICKTFELIFLVSKF